MFESFTPMTKPMSNRLTNEYPVQVTKVYGVRNPDGLDGTNDGGPARWRKLPRALV